MKILIVSQYFWPENFRINELAKNLRSRGHEITVLTGKPNYPQGKFFTSYTAFNKLNEYYHSIHILRAPLMPRGNTRIKLIFNYITYALNSFILGIYKKAYQTDLIFVYGPSPVTVAIPAILFKKIKSVPVIFWVQDLWPESVIAMNATKFPLFLYCITMLVRYIYKNCNLILTTSEDYFTSIMKHGISSDKLRYFPQCPEKVFQKKDSTLCYEQNNLLPNGFRIMFTGNIGQAQDIATILKAATLLKGEVHIKWIFLGDGSYTNTLLKEIKLLRLEQTVFWLGSFDIEDMPYFYACADVMLVSLKHDALFAKVIPAKIQGYMACAKPILAALDGITNKIINENSIGYASNSGDYKSLAKNALKMSNLTNIQKAKLGDNGYNYYLQHFETEKLLSNLENWMCQLTS